MHIEELPVKGMDPVVRKRKRQEQFLVLLSMGYNIKQACAMLKPPIDRKTYEKWRAGDPMFARHADSIRLSSGKPIEELDMDPNSFPVFRKKYFKHDSPPVHIEIADALDQGGKIILILIPPFHGKTTNLADKMCEMIAKKPNTRIGYVTESQNLARKVCGRLRRRMTEVRIAKEFISDYGPFYTPGQEKMAKPWGSDYFTVFKADHDENDYTFEALGWNSQIYGARWDVAVLDDYQTLRNTRNPKVTDNMVEIFQQDILTRVDLEDGGVVVIIGTRVAQRDFYSEIMNQGVHDTVIIRPAIDAQGNPLWEAKWDLEKLAKQRKRVGAKVWHRAYMMRPQDEGSATFTEATLHQCRNANYVIHQAADTNEDVWGSVDPAIDKWTAVCGAAVTPETFRMTEIRHKFEVSTGEGILTMIFEMWQKIRFSQLIVEAVSFQKALARDERLEKMKKECGFEIIEHTTALNKLDTTFGLARMASSFIDSSIILPWGDEDSQKAVQLLIDEALAWRATIPTAQRTQDILMATWFMWLRWQKLRKVEKEQQDELKAAAMPFSPTALPGGMTQYGPLVRGRS